MFYDFDVLAPLRSASYLVKIQQIAELETRTDAESVQALAKLKKDLATSLQADVETVSVVGGHNVGNNDSSPSS